MQEVITHIQKAVLQIATLLKFPDTAYSQNQNSSGDKQLKFDVMSDEYITQILSKCLQIKALISEEKEEALLLNEKAEFIVAFDPLDGSSLLDVNFAVGSIFAIYKNEAKAKNLLASAYSIYGARLEFVFCEKNSAPKLYRLNLQNEFEFIKELRLEEKGKILAPGATQKAWSEKHAKFIKSLFDEGYRLRYSGAMVSDVHQILCKGGGLFAYPATAENPQGKLRAFFEVLPLALMIENAGGLSSNGEKSVLECEFEKIHATSPCFLGSRYEINTLYKAYNE